MLHLPLEGMTHLPSFAFATSPAEIERGASYEFVLQHTIAVDDERELFRTEFEEVAPVRLSRSSQTLDDIADLVRAKNAGPFWITLDVFLADEADFDRVCALAGRRPRGRRRRSTRTTPSSVRSLPDARAAGDQDLVPAPDSPGQLRRPRHALRPAARAARAASHPLTRPGFRHAGRAKWT